MFKLYPEPNRSSTRSLFTQNLAVDLYSSCWIRPPSLAGNNPSHPPPLVIFLSILFVLCKLSLLHKIYDIKMSLNGRVGISVLLFHTGAFALYACNLVYESKYIVTPGSQTYGGRWKYLTHWNEVI